MRVKDISTMKFKIFLMTCFFLFSCSFLNAANKFSLSSSSSTQQTSLKKSYKFHQSWYNADVVLGCFVVKLKSASNASTSSLNQTLSTSNSKQAILDRVSGASMKQLFKSKASKSTFSILSESEKQNDLSNIYMVKYSGSEHPAEICRDLFQDDVVDYAEPYFIYKTLFDPNDPKYSSLWWLDNIQASQAWDITTGDTSITIGIVDSGVDWDHEDLSDNIKINWQEIPDDGIDNDGNGYIDDYRGWDFGSDDNLPGSGGVGDPDPSEPPGGNHGTHVSGIASGVTNNGIGIASIGYKTKILPVKASIDSQDPSSIYYGFEGVLYAAENGAQIVNCSWGGDEFSYTAKAIIDYVTEDLGVLVVAAAGNDKTNNDEVPIYPASYDNVLSVGNVTSSDIKYSNSNWGIRNCDVMAPGTAILSTGPDNSYIYNSGTSMASPLVSGIAALVKAKNPGYAPKQIIEQIRNTADNIDALNPSFAGELGVGRVNAYRALTENTLPGIRLKEVSFSNQDGYSNLKAGDTATIHLTIENVLSDAQSVELGVSSSRTDIEFLTFETSFPQMLSGAEKTTSAFSFVVSDTMHTNQEIDFLLEISANSGNYTTKTRFFEVVESNIISAQNLNNQIDITINNRGNIGYDDYYANTIGNGFQFKGNGMLFEGALMLGTSALTLNDVARINGVTQASDFVSTGEYGFEELATGDYVLKAKFEDNGGSSDLGLSIEHKAYVFNSVLDTSFVILSYDVENQSGVALEDFHGGLLVDWDIISYYNNESAFYEPLDLLYTFNPDQNIYAGVVILEGEPHAHVGSNDSLGIVLNDVSKWKYISSGIGETDAQGDLVSFYGAGPFTINSGDTLQLGFAMVAGTGLPALISNAEQAILKWQEITGNTSDVTEPATVVSSYTLYQNYPNPFNPVTNIKYTLPTSGLKAIPVRLAVYDILGREVRILVNKNQAPGTYTLTFDGSNLASGMYFYRLVAGEKVISKKMILLK